MDAGVLPVKRLVDAKSRLAGHFDPHERSAIARALLEDALDLCRAADFLEWWIVSDDEEVLEIARSRRFEVVRDPGTGLNAAVESAVRAAVAATATSATIVPVDVPLALRDDLADVVERGKSADVVVVPAGRDGGTNGLYLSPPNALRPRFGPDSLHGHVAQADRLGLRASVLALPRLALDIDTFEDVRALLDTASMERTRTGGVLQRLGAAGRLV